MPDISPYTGFLRKRLSSFRLCDKHLIILILQTEGCFRYPSAKFHFAWYRMKNRLAQNEKSFGWDWQIVRLRTFYRFPPWKNSERCLKHPSFHNPLYDNQLTCDLKDERPFYKTLGGGECRHAGGANVIKAPTKKACKRSFLRRLIFVPSQGTPYQNFTETFFPL